MPNVITCRSLLTALLLAGAGACVPMKPPANNAGPSLSDNGIALAVVSQTCAERQERDWRGANLVETSVAIAVRNSAPTPITIHRDKFRLLAPDGSALRTLTWGSADPLTVAGGASQTFELRFMTRGGLACTQEMRLDQDGGVALGAASVAFQPVRFTPERAL